MTLENLFRLSLKAARLAASRRYRAAMRQGVGASIENRDAVERVLPRFCADVGANKGQFSLLVRECRPDCRIVAFEPLAAPAERYRRLFAGDRLCTLHASAVGKEERRAEMNVSASADSSSLLDITERQNALFPGTQCVDTEAVTVTRLARHVTREDIVSPSLLKIDVQGYELAVLEGSAELLDAFDWVYVEASFVELYRGQALAADIIDHLHGSGFVLESVHNLHHDRSGGAVQADFLFANRRPVPPRSAATDRPARTSARKSEAITENCN